MRKILVDIHERESGIPELLEKFGVPFEIVPLEVGDYLISSKILIERKTLRDFANSLKSKRLHNQLYNLREKAEIPLIFLEGKEIYGTKGIHTKGLMGAISFIIVELGIPIIFSDSKIRTAEYIKIIYRRGIKPGEDYLYLPKKKARSREEEVLRVASSLPGVGPKIGIQLLKHFGSLKRLFNATERELLEVENIGKERAKRLLEIIHYEIAGEELFK